MQTYWTYIATNFGNTVLYTGVTNDIERRMTEHKGKVMEGFTKQYNVNKLVYVESFPTPEQAIAAEKRIKGWTRIRKIELIKIKNPEFRDLTRAGEGLRITSG